MALSLLFHGLSWVFHGVLSNSPWQCTDDTMDTPQQYSSSAWRRNGVAMGCYSNAMATHGVQSGYHGNAVAVVDIPIVLPWVTVAFM